MNNYNPGNNRSLPHNGSEESEEDLIELHSPKPFKIQLSGTVESKIRERNEINPQKQSSFFSKFPAEVRNRIYATALISIEDMSRPYHHRDCLVRPGCSHQRKVSGFLLTCRQAYLETHHLTVYLNEHRFHFMRDPLIQRIFASNFRDFFKTLTKEQASEVSSVHLYVSHEWLEGPLSLMGPLSLSATPLSSLYSHSLSNVEHQSWAPPMSSLNSPSLSNVEHLRLTIGIPCWRRLPSPRILGTTLSSPLANYALMITTMILLAYPPNLDFLSQESTTGRTSSEKIHWMSEANELIAAADRYQHRIYSSNPHQAGMLRFVIQKLKEAQNFALEGFKVFGQPLPDDGPDAWKLGLPALPPLSLDLRKTGWVDRDMMEELITAHNEGKQIDIEIESFAYYVSKMPKLKTLTIEFDVLDFYRHQLKTIVDHARTWVFPREPVERVGSIDSDSEEVEMRVITDTEVEEWHAFTQAQEEAWERICDFERPCDKAVTMKLTWNLVPKDTITSES